MVAKSRTTNGTPKKGRRKERDWKPIFIRELATSGNISHSCAMTNIPRKTAYNNRDSDPDFRAAWDEAIAIAVDFLEGEARRRAVEGTLKPIYQGGKLVGEVREFSDTLLIFLLKAQNPMKYRDNISVRHSGGTSQTHIYLPDSLEGLSGKAASNG